ncbi:hypothetical protein WCX49_01975 [Sulfurimonas sp. HSL-1656]|uniref:hypothetical protein n=1 Tax=Thiomicrolovo subterrani TaxID=3131934 RepID=UPI0031F9641E
MIRLASFLFMTTVSLQAALLQSSTVPCDTPYFTAEIGDCELIYTEANLPVARTAAAVENAMLPQYDKLYGYTMDETLYVGLLSSHNQIANGFSTPYPNNRQINYGGGALMIDYFSATSWLNTLLFHETAHNYQMNAKDNPVSGALHTVFGNGFVLLPWFTLPNIVESSFLLEGNAVLNESWHGNGGRLYSGRFKAATLQQAKAGLLTPERVYNAHYDFLYGSHFYTLGGFYQYDLANTYGMADVNAYWKEHSYEWFWPFFTNSTTRRTIGYDFETSLRTWADTMAAEARDMTDVEGSPLAATQFYTPINSDDDAVYFTVNATGRSFPELIVYDKKSGRLTRESGSYRTGKVVRTPEGRYATQSSAYTSPLRIEAGLYTEGAHLIDGTAGRVIEGYLRDGTPVYFDVPASFDQPQLFVGDSFYARTNSSVFIDGEDNLYYFVQGEGKTRTLYKNKTPLFSLRGHYGNVSGVDSRGRIYFIANTPHGSGLFRYDDGKITRAHPADTLFEARLIDDTHALAAVMKHDAYTYQQIPLETIDETPYEVTLFFENTGENAPETNTTAGAIGLEHPYRSPLELHYSGTDVALGSDSDTGLLYTLSLNFADPLTRNALSAFVTRNVDAYTLGGMRYANSEYLLQFAVTAYGVIDTPERNATEPAPRHFGFSAEAELPFWQRGYAYGALRGTYYQDYEADTRTPISVALPLARSEQYGVSMYRNALYALTPYSAFDRGDAAWGAEAVLERDLSHEFYLALGGQYSQSSADNGLDARGVKLATGLADKLKENDPSTVIMPTLRDTTYAKSALKADAELRKVFNLSAYFFTFPVSLRREALRAGYAYYDLEPFNPSAPHLYTSEASAGLTLDTFWFNKLPLPITVDYYYSDSPLASDRHTVRFGLGIAY